MTDPMDRALGAWLREGPERGPDARLHEVLSATRRLDQRPGWAIPERWLPMQLTATRIPSMRPFLSLALLGLLIASVAVAMVLVGSQQRRADPFGLARNGVVVYEADGDLYTAETWGASPRPLVTSTAREYRPTFSRQGTEVAFFREGAGGADLFVTRPGGETVTRIAGPFPLADRLQWSADGRTILVTYEQSGLPRMSVVRVEDGIRQDVRVGMPAQVAALRPDGQLIAFRGQPSDGSAPSGLFLVRPDGSDLREVDLGDPAGSTVDVESLTWSPDGSRLAFMTDGRSAGLEWQISIVTVDASGLAAGVESLALVPGASAEMLPVWSPDGARLAFVLEQDGRRRIGIVGADGSGQVEVVGPDVATDADGVGHAWSPDGALLYVTFLHSGPRPEVDGAGQTFWVVDVATGATERITDRALVDIPDQQRLAP